MMFPRSLLVILITSSLTFPAVSQAGERWSAEKVNTWYAKQHWPIGCNYIPSTAINQLEMWQAETFDLETIDRELGWAEGLGFNTVRSLPPRPRLEEGRSPAHPEDGTVPGGC